jgi:V/A-type H+-transporting ATPase subunit A
VRALGRPERAGSLTFISAVSPPGGDFSEPVTQASLRVAGALWALDPELAHARHFPAVDWETSYSLYAEGLLGWFAEHAGGEWVALRRDTLALLQRAGELREIAGLVGPEALQDEDRLALEAARAVRETLLAQSAYDSGDASSSPEKTYQLALLLRSHHRQCLRALAGGASLAELDLEPARAALERLRAAEPAELIERAEAAATVIDRLTPARESR